MADPRLPQLLRTAQAMRLVPADATLAPPQGRPWPVVLLTGLGAWLAAVPLILLLALLLDEQVQSGQALYWAGALLLAAGVTVLRSRGLPLFVEQLALPALLAGGGALAVALARDLSQRGTAAALLAIVLALVALLPRPWLRVLLGALAAGLAVLLLLPASGARMDDMPAFLWGALHLPLLAALAGWAAQDTALAHGRRARLAAALEPALAGWLALLLAGLAAWSGMTLLAGAVVGPAFATGAGQATGFTRVAVGIAMPAASVLLALAGGRLASRDWPTLWQPLTGVAGAVLVVLSWFMPALGGLLLALAAAATTHRWRLAALATLAVAWTVGAFYYQLRWTLADKALVLALAGAALGALAWLAHRRAGGAPLGQGLRLPWRPALGIALAAIATLALVNHGIWRNEQLIAQGEPVFVRLAPVDPRSLLQGDYMQLSYRLPPAPASVAGLGARRPMVVARKDARGVAELLRVAPAGAPLAAGEFPIALTRSAGGWTLVSDAWHFAEGDAARWERARYAEFRVAPAGRALLVGLADERLQRIPAAP